MNSKSLKNRKFNIKNKKKINMTNLGKNNNLRQTFLFMIKNQI
jgi:hypothetical protein